jgi:hypothetical protein
MPIKTAIYDPPIKGLPYLIVTLEADGAKDSSVPGRTQTATFASSDAANPRVPVKKIASRPVYQASDRIAARRDGFGFNWFFGDSRPPRGQSYGRRQGWGW